MTGVNRALVLRVLVVGIATVGFVVPAPAAGLVVSEDATADAGPTWKVTPIADQPETCDEFLTSFRNASDLASLSEYAELDVIRTQASVEVQTGDCSESKVQRMTLVYRILVTFDRAYLAAQNGSARSGEASLRFANQTAEAIDGLRETGNQEYVALSRLALDRFYRNRGQELTQLAEDAEGTPQRIELLRLAALAYQRAGLTERYGKLTIRANDLETDYQRDVKQLNESISAATAFLEGCGESCVSPREAALSGPAVFGQYRQAKRHHRQVDQALRIADDHNIEERADAVRELRSETQTAQQTLAVASAGLAMGYVSLSLLVTVLVALRLMRWRQDLDDSRIGDVLMTEEIIDG